MALRGCPPRLNRRKKRCKLVQPKVRSRHRRAPIRLEGPIQKRLVVNLVSACAHIHNLVCDLFLHTGKKKRKGDDVHDEDDEDENIRVQTKRKVHNDLIKYTPWWHFLPPQSITHIGKPTLVLDLDETLIYSSASRATYCRPGLAPFLSTMAASFELVIFTSSKREYADKIVDQLDPHGVLFAHRLYRDSCTLEYGRYVKDLSRLGRDLRRVIIIDNNSNCFKLQFDNGIHVPSFLGHPTDQMLLVLQGILEQIKNEEDLVAALINKRKHNLLIRDEAKRVIAEAFCNRNNGIYATHKISMPGNLLPFNLQIKVCKVICALQFHLKSSYNLVLFLFGELFYE